MSEGNGIIRTRSKGRKKFAIGEDGLPFEIDVIKVQDEWFSTDRAFRDEKGVIVDYDAWKTAAREFVERVSKTNDLDDCTVLEFLELLRQEAAKLHDFFVPKPAAKPALLEPTVGRLTFSA